MRPLFSLLVFGLAVSACGTTVTPLGNEPFDFNTAPYATSSETVRLPAGDTQALYAAVLEFYRPGPGHARWLDRVLLPSQAAGERAPLDSAIAASLVNSLRGSFCVLSGTRDCRGKTAGGILRISPVYQAASGEARVVVEFSGVEENGPATVSSLVFLLGMDDGKWRIMSRGPAKVPS
jgi:hypothetical protein